MALTSFFKKSSSDSSPSPTEKPIEDAKEPSKYDGWDPESQAKKNSVSNGDRKMSRIGAPRNGSIVGMDTDSEESVSVGRQMELEKDNAIKYRTCSWPKIPSKRGKVKRDTQPNVSSSRTARLLTVYPPHTAALLFSEYISLAIMSFPYSYSVLGLVPGLILTVIVAAIVLYTSLVLWEFCLRHPEVRDVCDIGQMLFWGKRWAWWATGVMFVLNNTFIQGFHCVTGAEYLNTVSNGGTCTIVFGMVWAIICWVFSLPRTFDTLSKLGTGSAIFTFISVLLAAIFAGIEKHPAGWPYGDSYGGPISPQVLVVPLSGTTFVAGMSAFLNISYTFIGQITLPSFIAEMKEPKDFPKALWAVTIAEILVFSICGGVTYAYTGTNYNVAPAFGTLGNHTYQIVSFSFMIPTLIFLGVLYASVSARFIFFNIFQGTKHMGSHTVVGWASWAGILAVLWIFAFIIAEVIPFFSDLLSLMSSLFDSFFGFIFWGMAYLLMRKAEYGPGYWRKRGARGMIGFAVNWLWIIVGIYVLGVGTYVSVQSIIDGYKAGNFGGAFSCASTALAPAVNKQTHDAYIHSLNQHQHAAKRWLLDGLMNYSGRLSA